MAHSKFLSWLILILVLFSIWVNMPPLGGLPDSVNVLNHQISLSPLKTDKWTINIKGKDIDLSFLTPDNLFGKYPVKLGLDLQGGTELTLQANMDKIAKDQQDTALEAARQVIERRVNFYGVSEAVVRTAKVGNERRILVELPGVKDLNTAINLVGKTAQLEFRELPSDYVPNASDSAMMIFEATPSGITGADIKDAQVSFNNSSGGQTGPAVTIDFTNDGANKFSDVTKRNVGRPLPIFLDGSPISAPVVQQEIIGGHAVISGNFTTDEAKNLAIQLNAGALPVPITVLTQQQINPSLGSEFLQKSIIAGSIGLLAVMIFMVAFYGRYGIVADIALIIYALLVLAIFRTGLFILPKVTLSLAGIAGFILSVGMAVDANILTFERIKEEKRAGKKGRIALEHGFARAWTSIRDSNISSIITASILYILGTSIVKGFALTLGIGVVVSLFSAITVTRLLLGKLPEFK